jgi:hypothetical protein
MRSTRQFLEYKIEKQSGDHEKRITALGISDVPEEYSCAIQFTLMDEPVNINPPEIPSKRYLNRKSYLQLSHRPINANGTALLKGEEAVEDELGRIIACRINPFSNVGIVHKVEVCKQQQDIIASYVFIEEIKAHLAKLETTRHAGLVMLEQVKDNEFDATLLLTHSNDILAANNISLQTIPAKFFCAHHKNRVMTFPVIIDHEHIIDFYSLIEHQHDDETHQYLNPITGKPISCIEVDYQLLQEIDSFLCPVENQMRGVEAMAVHQQKAMNKYLDPHSRDKSYAQILADEAYPADKIPESLALGRIPGKDQLELMTHPVLLDGEDLIDLLRLQEFWKPVPGMLFGRPGCHGINPFTMQPIKTIAYDEELKDSTDKFFLNRNMYKEIISEKNVRDASYLRTKFSAFHTLSSDADKKSGLSRLTSESISSLSNANGKN